MAQTDGVSQVRTCEVMYSLRAYGGNHLGMFAGVGFRALNRLKQLTVDKIRGSFSAS